MNDLSVSVRPAANGYVVHYQDYVNDMEVNAEFIAINIDEALNIVHDCLIVDEHTHDMSNILDETIPKG